MVITGVGSVLVDMSTAKAVFEDVDYEKLVKMDETVDALHMRHGIDVKMHETFLKSPITHMSGDISWEKHTMDDSKLRIE